MVTSGYYVVSSQLKVFFSQLVRLVIQGTYSLHHFLHRLQWK